MGVMCVDADFGEVGKGVNCDEAVATAGADAE